MIKFDWSIIKWWQIVIVIVLFAVIIYFLNRDKTPYKFIGLQGALDPNYTFTETKPASIKYKCEEKCRETLQRLYGIKFTKTRPNWLLNPETGRNLEIDCYNNDLKIGCEYDGEQHYIFPNRWHKYKWEFDNQMERDRLKNRLCENNGVLLIRVPYTVPLKDIPYYIEGKLRENNKL